MLHHLLCWSPLYAISSWTILYTDTQVPDAPSTWVADAACEIKALAACLGNAGAVCSPAIAARVCQNSVPFCSLVSCIYADSQPASVTDLLASSLDVAHVHVCHVLLQVWVHAAGCLAETVLAGLVRVRAKGTAASRGAMFADLAEVPIGLCCFRHMQNQHAATQQTNGARTCI